MSGYIITGTMYTAGMSKTAPWQDRAIPEPNSGCWLWEGASDIRGYCFIKRGGKQYNLHRFVWQETHGPIPKGMSVCHTCDVPSCCNPDHLFLGSPKDNTQDMVRKGRHSSTRKTHCKYGHPFTEDRTGIYRYGWRVCLECARLRTAARRAG